MIYSIKMLAYLVSLKNKPNTTAQKTILPNQSESVVKCYYSARY